MSDKISEEMGVFGCKDGREYHIDELCCNGRSKVE